MFPIHEKKGDNVIGCSFQEFSSRFIEICNEHIENDKAKAFAFIFWDFKNDKLQHILNSYNGLRSNEFTKLDRLSGQELTIFYLDSNNKRLFHQFNRFFIRKFQDANHRNLSLTLPFIVLFKVKKERIIDAEFVMLNQKEINSAFDDLYIHIDEYLNTQKHKSQERFENIKCYTQIGLQLLTSALIGEIQSA
jgi:hypothetical protein|tara:strand:+ start:95 stop:670 length:576 start_codon:yes stop_codon:yes gene_type:complete